MNPTTTSHPSIDRFDFRGRSVFSIAGDLDLETSGEVLSALIEGLGEQDRHPMILDLSGVSHMDSSGMGALISARAEARRQNVHLVLTGLNDAPRRALAKTRLDNFFEVTKTMDEALSLTGR